jgi:hypothetical protein
VSATGTATRNTHGQPSSVVIRPPSTAPAIAAELPTTDAIPNARLRSVPGGKVALISDREAGALIAAPAPCTARAASITAGLDASPAPSEPAAKTTRPMTSMRRRPTRSPSRPPRSRSPPNGRV